MKHLKRMTVGLFAGVGLAAIIGGLIWLGYYHGTKILIGLLCAGIIGALYGLGYSLTEKSKKAGPEQPRGGGAMIE